MSTYKKDILIFTSEFPPLPGGIGNHAYDLAKFLEIEGRSVSVLADQRTDFEIENKFDNGLGFEVFRIKLTKPRMFMYFKRLRMFFKLASKHDRIIISGKFPLWIGAIYKTFFNTKTIAIIHGSEVNFSNKLLKKTIDLSLKKVDAIVAVSNYTKSLIDHLALNKVMVITNGLDISKWNINEVKDNKKLKGTPSLLTVGNVSERKGQLNVIEHLTVLKKDFPEVHYHCVGLPTQKEELMQRAKIIGVDSNISFHGTVNHEKLKMFYNAADIFVMLSGKTKTGDVEGFGIAILEANYFGLPVIGSIGCGIEDAINNKNSGLLIKPKSVNEFVDSVKLIIDNYNSYSKKAHEWAIQHSWKNKINRYIKIIYS